MSNPVPDKRLLAAKQLAFRRAVSLPFKRLADHICGLLLAQADGDGDIPFERLPRLKAQVGRSTLRLFLGADGNAYKEDGITAQADFPHLLNAAYAQLVAETVHAHDRFLQSYLPKQHYEALATIPSRPAHHNNPPENPSIRQMARVRENVWLPPPEIRQRMRIFEPNPLAFIDPTRSWVNFNGQGRFVQGRNAGRRPYRLSDAIWRTGHSTRNQIETLLQQGVAGGISAIDLANSLENLLIPDRTTRRTFWPYNDVTSFGNISGQAYMGDNGVAFDAMRLAHTELSRAFNEATFMNGVHNPAVIGMDWRLSAQHPKTDRCDQKATLGMGGERLAEPMPLHAAILPPDHPFCICSARSYVGDDSDREQLLDDIAATLIAERDRVLAPVMTPAQSNLFIRGLLGDILTELTGVPLNLIAGQQRVLPLEPPF